MFSITVKDKAGHSATHTFDESCGEVTIGRADDNAIQLPLGNVSQYHSRIRVASGQFIIQDLNSTNGTFVNRQRVTQAQVLLDADIVQIGHFRLELNTKLKAPEKLTLSAKQMTQSGVVVGQSTLPLVSTSIEAWVLGPAVGMRVVQRYRVPAQSKGSALYVLPMEAQWVLGHLQVRMRDRLIQSQIKEGTNGPPAPFSSEQERPDVLVAALGNISPGEEIEVTVELSAPLEWCGKRWRLMLPASLSSPTRVLQGEGRGPGLRIVVWIDTACGLASVGSPSHPWRFSQDGRRWQAVFEQRHPRMEQDVSLHISPERPESPTAWLVPSASSATMAMVHLPPPRSSARYAREMIFVLDCSSSFQSQPLAQAKAALKSALGQLGGADTFNVFWLGSHTSSLWGSSVDVDVDDLNIHDAITAIDKATNNQGGKDIAAALLNILETPPDGDRQRCVVLLSDGGADDIAQMVACGERMRGRAQLMVCGVHARGNARALEALADAADGRMAFLDPHDAPEPVIEALMSFSHGPVWRDVRVAWGDLQVEQAPAISPPVHGGDATVILARVRRGQAQALTLMAAEQSWNLPLLPCDELHQPTLARLWAHTTITDLSRRLHGPAASEHRGSIAGISLRHQVLSPMTHITTASDRPIAVTQQWRQWPPATPRGGNTPLERLKSTIVASATEEGMRPPRPSITGPQSPEPGSTQTIQGRIAYTNSAGEGCTVRIARDFPEVTLGRNPGCVIRANNLTVSRSHARFLMVGETCTLFDLDSSHGTFVNDERITSKVLKDGDQIRCGDFELSYAEVMDDRRQPRLTPLPEAEDVLSTASKHLSASQNGELMNQLEALRKEREADKARADALKAEVERYREEQKQLIRDLHRAEGKLREAPQKKWVDDLQRELVVLRRERDAMDSFIQEIHGALGRWEQVSGTGWDSNISQAVARLPRPQQVPHSDTRKALEEDETAEADWLLRLLATQQPDGSFLMGRDLMRWLGAQTDVIMNASAVHGEALVVTKVVVSLLSNDAAERVSDWRPAVERAQRWLTHQNDTLDIEPLLGR